MTQQTEEQKKIIQLSNGNETEKVRAVQIILSGSHGFTPEELEKLLEKLSQRTESESVRVALAVWSGKLPQRLHGIFSAFSNDPSEVVREQARVSEANNEQEQSVQEKSNGLEETKSKPWSTETVRKWIKEQRLIISVMMSAVIFDLTIWLLIFLKTDLLHTTMETLTQINATIFALAFTIPLAASQLSRYQTNPGSIFDKTNLIYFLTYAVAIFLPILSEGNRGGEVLAFALSAMCTFLLIPFLFRTSEKLTSKKIVGERYREILEKWNEGTDEGLREYGSSIENIARAALASKDYSTFALTIDAMISLVRRSMDLKEKISYGPQQLGARGLEQAIVRLGQETFSDKFALAIWCATELDLITHTSFCLKATDHISALKFVEFKQLSELLSISQLSSEAERLICLFLIEWAIQNKYTDPKEADRKLDFCAGVLSTRPVDVIESVINDTTKRIDVYSLFGAVSYSDPIRPIRFSIFSTVRIHLKDMLTRLMVKVSEFSVTRMMPSVDTKATGRIQISRATSDDASYIVMLQRVCYLPEATKRNDLRIPELTESSANLRTEMKRSTVLKATLDNAIIGSVRGSVDDYGKCCIRRLFVHPSFSKCGVGGDLLAEIEKAFAREKTLFVYLGATDSQKTTFLQKYGYSNLKEYSLTNELKYGYMEKVRKIKTARAKAVRPYIKNSRRAFTSAGLERQRDSGSK